MYFFVSFKSFFKVGLWLILIFVYSRHEVIFTIFFEDFDSFIVHLIVYIFNLVPSASIVLKGVHNSLHLQICIKPELTPNF